MVSIYPIEEQMILTVSIWRPHEFEEQLTYVENNNITVTKIIYFGQYEHSGSGLVSKDEILSKVLNYATILEIPIYVVTNNLSQFFEAIRRIEITIPKTIKLIEWDTFYFANLWYHVSYEVRVNSQSPANLYHVPELYNFSTEPNSRNYHYISLNNHPIDARCIMMDTLAKHELINYGAISWLQTAIGRQPKEPNEKLLQHLHFKFKYWIPKIIKLDIVRADHHESKFYRGKVPHEYNYSFMHLITESYLEWLFISEKTPIALLLMKPFLVVGAKGFHQNLERLGFKLYDEIFDYSFDLEDTVEARCEGVARNIKKISELSIEELNNLYNSLLNKLKHNRKLALGFATTIPDEVRELWDMKEEFINKNFDGEFANLIHNLDN